jgi:hsp70-interacting protein
LDPSPSSSVTIRAKAIYTLSGLLKHNSPAVKALDADGWTKFRGALQGKDTTIDSSWGNLIITLFSDPAISVRRKTIFLLSSLLIPSSSSTNPQQQAADNNDDDPSSSTTNTLTPDTTRQQPIYPNSHSAHLQDPSRTSTSELTLNAFRQYQLEEAIISAVTSPLPYGDDGEHTEADLDFEEKIVR